MHHHLLIINIGQLVGVEHKGSMKKLFSGKEMAYTELIENAWLYIEDRKIHSFGKMTDMDFMNAENVFDAQGKSILPAFVDSHTHLVFASSREQEFEDRIKGLSYEEIANRGGGILNSAKKLNEISESELFDISLQRLHKVMSTGTGAIEIKSGYGLSYEGEIKMLRVIKKLKETNILPIKATFLAAHAYPLAFRQNHEGYLNCIIYEMLPVVANEGLAEYIDVFCEEGFFSVDETKRVLEAGNKYGLKPKIHANQLHFSGGVEVGVEYNSISVDHLECVGEKEINALLGSKTIPTLLPAAAFFLGMHYQPARKMIDAGLPVCLATDYNPGSCPSGNIPLLMTIACTQLKMTPIEAFNSVTINGAAAVEMSDRLGTIAAGKIANLILTTKMPSIACIPYDFGNNPVEKLMINGNFI